MPRLKKKRHYRRRKHPTPPLLSEPAQKIDGLVDELCTTVETAVRERTDILRSANKGLERLHALLSLADPGDDDPQFVTELRKPAVKKTLAKKPAAGGGEARECGCSVKGPHKRDCAERGKATSTYLSRGKPSGKPVGKPLRFDQKRLKCKNCDAERVVPLDMNPDKCHVCDSTDLEEAG